MRSGGIVPGGEPPCQPGAPRLLPPAKPLLQRSGEEVEGLSSRCARPWQAPRFEDYALSEWQGLVHDNIDGAIAAIQAALPSMRA